MDANKRQNSYLDKGTNVKILYKICFCFILGCSQLEIKQIDRIEEVKYERFIGGIPLDEEQEKTARREVVTYWKVFAKDGTVLYKYDNPPTSNSIKAKWFKD